MSSPMPCKNCGSQTGESDSFCMQCGTSLLDQCANCGTELPENAKFCRQCGGPSSLEGPAGVGQAEQDVQQLVSDRAEVWEVPTERTTAANQFGKFVGIAFVILIFVWMLWGPIRDTFDTDAPIIFSDGQASALLLKTYDFPKNWIVHTNGMRLDAQNDYMADFEVKTIVITLETHETEEAAQAAFSTKKTEAQTAIDVWGISGAKLEDVKKYPMFWKYPMFVWNASDTVETIYGREKWTVVGVYGNITMEVFHEGSVGAPKKSFAVHFAKDQMDRITGD